MLDPLYFFLLFTLLWRGSSNNGRYDLYPRVLWQKKDHQSFFDLDGFSLLPHWSSLFHLPNSPLLIGIGMFLVGAFRGICKSLCLGDAFTGGIKEFPELEDWVADLVSSTYTFFFGIISLVFPIFGSALVEEIGFRLAIDIVSLILTLNSLLYFTVMLVECRKKRKQSLKFEEEVKYKKRRAKRTTLNEIRNLSLRKWSHCSFKTL